MELAVGFSVLISIIAIWVALAIRGRLRRVEMLTVALVHSLRAGASGRGQLGGTTALRAPVNVPAKVRFGASTAPGRLTDLSKTGCRLAIDEPAVPGVRVVIDIQDRTPISLQGVVKRVLGEGEVGIAFVDLDRNAQGWINKTFSEAFFKLLEGMS